MRRRLLDILRCPLCRKSLDLFVFSEAADAQVETGVLRCPCGAWYPIIGSVPRMLSGALRPSYADFIAGHAAELRPLEIRAVHSPGTQSLSKARTSESFGFEWSAFSSFGWEGPEAEAIDLADPHSHSREHLMAHTIATFHRKTLLRREELEGRLVLDVGCGNGRYAHVASRNGAEVVGLDLSRAVDVAAANTRDEPRIHIVQADLFNAPFCDATFDVIYSIGVLHHTPDTRGAFEALLPRLRPGGLISIHLYHKGNPLWELVDRCLRLVTTRIPLHLLWYGLYAITALGKVAFTNRYLYAAVNAVVRAQPVHHHNFDWYSAPVAWHHTGEEVAGWFRAAGLEELEDDDPARNPDAYHVQLYPHFARTSEGTIKPIFCSLYPRWGLTVKGRLPARDVVD